MTTEQIERLKDLFKETYYNYMISKRMYLSTSDSGDAKFRENCFRDYIKYLESICVLDSVMDILDIKTADIEMEVQANEQN